MEMMGMICTERLSWEHAYYEWNLTDHVYHNVLAVGSPYIANQRREQGERVNRASVDDDD